MNTVIERTNERKISEYERYEDMKKFFEKQNQSLLFENICYFDSSNNSIVLRENSQKNIQTYQAMNEVYINHLRGQIEMLNLKNSPLFEVLAKDENETIQDSKIFDAIIEHGVYVDYESDGEIEEDLILEGIK